MIRLNLKHKTARTVLVLWFVIMLVLSFENCGKGFQSSTSISNSTNSTAGTGTTTINNAPNGPTVSLTENPNVMSPTTSTTVTFDFAVTQGTAAISTVTCSLDYASPASCTSPLTLNGLTVGQHAFNVVATDSNLLKSTATFSWTVTTASTPPSALAISVKNAAPVNQGATMQFPIVLSAPSSSPVTVTVQTADGTAKANIDYMPINSIVTIPAGSVSATAQVITLIDNQPTTDLTFSLNVTASSIATITQASASGTVLLPAIKQIISGTHDSCAIMKQNTVECWQHGLPLTGLTTAPTLIAGLTNIKTLSISELNWAFLTYDGVVVSGLSPQNGFPMIGLTGVSNLNVGENSYCYIDSTNGGVHCAGDNTYGELGDGTTSSFQTSFSNVTGLSGMVSVMSPNTMASGINSAVCSLSQLGKVYCWGPINNGKITISPTPVLAPDLQDIIQMSDDRLDKICAVHRNGTVSCFNPGVDNTNVTGNFGNSVTVGNIANAISVAGNSGTFCAVISTGTVSCWQYPGSAIGIQGLANIRQVAVDQTQICALGNTGSVVCFPRTPLVATPVLTNLQFQ